MKKTESKKTKIESICDLVDCYIENEISQNELTHKLMKFVDKPIIRISEMEWIVQEWKDNLSKTKSVSVTIN